MYEINSRTIAMLERMSLFGNEIEKFFSEPLSSLPRTSEYTFTFEEMIEMDNERRAELRRKYGN